MYHRGRWQEGMGTPFVCRSRDGFNNVVARNERWIFWHHWNHRLTLILIHITHQFAKYWVKLEVLGEQNYRGGTGAVKSNAGSANV